MSSPTKTELLHAYRNLYRHLLRAVQLAKPARYVARDQLRKAFRTEPQSNFNSRKITRTITFLKGAAQERGIEHKILKNLLLTKWWEQRTGLSTSLPTRRPEVEHLKDTAMVHYEMTIAMLNDTMDLCLR